MTRPLSVKTLSRIYAGAIRFGWSVPDLAKLRCWMTTLGYTPPSPETAPKAP